MYNKCTIFSVKYWVKLNHWICLVVNLSHIGYGLTLSNDGYENVHYMHLFSVFTKHLYTGHRRYAYLYWPSSRSLRAITNLRLFLSALIKPIHADLQLINFVRRKGQVCIFAVQDAIITILFQRVWRGTPAALEPIKPLTWECCFSDDCRDHKEQLCQIVWRW